MRTDKYNVRLITIDTLSESVWKHFRHPLPNLFLAKGCATVGQVAGLSDGDFLDMRNFGIETLRFIIRIRNFIGEHRNLYQNMKQLTTFQLYFLLEYFFKNEKFAGWQNIAITLLKEGECIVAGTECIWIGGIGNFIKTTEVENAVGCSLYKFDLDYFLTSEWYKSIHEQYIAQLTEKKEKAEQEFNEIINLK
jgi:hypothetical protein